MLVELEKLVREVTISISLSTWKSSSSETHYAGAQEYHQQQTIEYSGIIIVNQETDATTYLYTHHYASDK